MDEVLREPKSNWGRRLLWLLLVAALVYGAYWGYTTGELLNVLNWLLKQDVILLTIIAAVGLVVIAAIMGG
jgi:hypothetical protein